MADLVTKILRLAWATKRSSRVIVYPTRLALGPSSPPSQGQQVVAPRDPLGARKTCCPRPCQGPRGAQTLAHRRVASQRRTSAGRIQHGNRSGKRCAALWGRDLACLLVARDRDGRAASASGTAPKGAMVRVLNFFSRQP